MGGPNTAFYFFRRINTGYSEEVNPYERNTMFKNHKLEIRLAKDAKTEAEVAKEPIITKDEIIDLSKKAVKYVVGGVLIILASAAAIDTAKFAAMTAIENRSDSEED